MISGEPCGKSWSMFSEKPAAGDQSGHVGCVYALIIVTKQM